MIVRHYLKPLSVLRFTWRSTAFFVLVAVLAAVLYGAMGQTQLAIPMSAVGPLGTALAIFLAFRNGSAYDRWWEARKLWGQLVNDSRTFTRQILTFVTPGHGAKMSPDAFAELHRELVYRHLAFVNAVRLRLRGQKDCGELSPFIDEAELDVYRTTPNIPSSILQKQGACLRDAMHSGMIEHFRHMQLDNTLSRLTDILGGCERIKNTPVPRQYDYFPQTFLYVYAFFLPFGLVADFGWFTALISLPISYVFLTLLAAGRVNEDPFENRSTDTPMSTLSRSIEIDLRAHLGEAKRPEPLALVDGVAF